MPETRTHVIRRFFGTVRHVAQPRPLAARVELLTIIAGGGQCGTRCLSEGQRFERGAGRRSEARTHRLARRRR